MNASFHSKVRVPRMSGEMLARRQSVADLSDSRDPLDRLAEEFLSRFRAGERPSLTEYVNRLPERAEEIRELFPALVELEQLKPPEDQPTGDLPAAIATTDPQHIGDFRILRRIGNGGMGVVYEAIQESLGRHVALKLLPLEVLNNPRRLARFRNEASSAARLHHSNIVPVFGTGEADGRHYYAMQYIAGHPLDAIIDEVRRQRELPGGVPPAPEIVTVIATALMTGEYGHPTVAIVAGDTDDSGGFQVSDPPPAPPAKSPPSLAGSLSDDGRAYWVAVARLGLQVAEALAYAHGEGVLHRDIKPANLLLDLKGTVWITDFGLAKAKESADLTVEGEIVGTLRYMAPERFAGAGDRRADIYALGLTLYELLTLRPAFDAENKPKLIEQAVAANPPRPRSINTSIPRDLETVVLKAIARDPDERYPNAEELASDLRRFVEDRPVQARRATPTEQLWRWCRRNPAVASLIATVFLVTAVGAVTASVFAIRADANARQAGRDRDRAQAAELEGRRKLFESYLAEAKANRMSRRPGQRFGTLERVRQAADLGRELEVPQERFDELRQIAITALAMPDMLPRYLGEVPENVRVCNISDDLSRVILQEKSTGQHVVCEVGSGRELFRLPPTGEIGGLFSPGGRYILRYNPMEVWSVADGKPKLVIRDSQEFSFHFFCADGHVLAMASNDGTLVVWDLQKGFEVHRSHLPGITRGPVFALHPTAPLVACCSYSTPRVSVLDYHTDRVVQTVDPPWPGGSTGITWAPDGRRLFVAAGDSNGVQEYSFEFGTRTLVPDRKMAIHGSGPGGNQIIISLAGDRIANYGWGKSLGLFDLETARELSTHPRISFFDFRFSADGQSLVGILGQPHGRPSYGVLDLGDAREVRTITLSQQGGLRPVIHPGGRLVVIPRHDSFLFVDAASLKELGAVKLGAVRKVNCAFDGQGRLYSNNFGGLFRWPVRIEGNHATVGPPERLPFHPGAHGISVSSDGRTVAQAEFGGYGMGLYAGGWAITPSRPDDPLYLGAGLSLNDASLTRDGRLACLDVNEDGAAVVYDTSSGTRVWEDREHVLGPGARFTADGRWLVGSWGACRVGDWESHVVLDRSRTDWPLDLSPDSRMALLNTTGEYAHLVEIATGREIARLEGPAGGIAESAFSVDGTRLLEASGEGLRVWNLRRIRARLAELGLDWDAPAFPPDSEDSPGVPPPLQLTILGGELLSDPAKLAEYDRAVTAMRLFANPLDAQGHLEVARQLIGENEPAKALAHLRVATLTRPRSYEIRINAGQCLLNLGRAREAIPEFTAAMTAQPEDNRARYRRSLAYRQLGRFAEAAEDLTAILARFPEAAELYEERAKCHAKLGDTARATADRAAADRYFPRSADGLNNRAWNLLIASPGSRDNPRALELSQKAVKIEPENGLYMNTLGVALYRNDRFTEAIATLEKNLAAGKGELDAFDLFFLAMSHARVGDVSKAKQEFDRAVAWMGRKKDLSGQYAAELAQFRQEAEKVLKQP